MYNEAHKVLLTYIRSIKTISSQDLLDALVLISQRLNSGEERITLDLLNQYISDINLEISQQGFKIERKNDENDGILYYIFINTMIDDIMKETTAYSVPELVSIKYIIAEIIDKSNFEFSASKNSIQQIVSQHQNKSLRDSSLFINRLIDDGWLVLTMNDDLILSIKSLCELKQYLIDGFGYIEDNGKILSCSVCKDLVTLGLFKAENNNAFHRKCYDVYCRNNDIQHQDRSLMRVGPDPSTI
ncbi:hypothetical protein KGF54_000699 [Candida jiufengensis]|uniref:uncharacterized protein n=1 Tax=Candida jiufengensis TaxID=497108 RepID=UPI00222577A9|nr:uncharacterized protein KGF54_000699 [Candida jiufengensis]KAI5956224.1 hypothetical protein KGF54_000699 [Candida jiufengensis]